MRIRFLEGAAPLRSERSGRIQIGAIRAGAYVGDHIPVEIPLPDVPRLRYREAPRRRRSAVDDPDRDDDGDGASGGTEYCVLPATGSSNNVGSESPKGDGKYGQADLAGNAWEWTLDWFAPYLSSCVNCSNGAAGGARVLRGGSLIDAASYLLSASRADYFVPTNRSYNNGARCARAP